MSSVTIDARGLKCPLPVLRAEKALEQAEPGGRLTLLATDPVARIDIVHYCRQHGHAVTVSGTTELRFEIVKAGA